MTLPNVFVRRAAERRPSRRDHSIEVIAIMLGLVFLPVAAAHLGALLAGQEGWSIALAKLISLG